MIERNWRRVQQLALPAASIVLFGVFLWVLWRVFSAPTISAAQAALFGAVVGGSFTALSQILLGWLQLKQDRERQANERERERQQWLREQALEIYGNCMESLVPLTTMPYGQATGADEYTERLYTEAQKWLALLLLIHPDPSSSDFARLSQKIVEFTDPSHAISPRAEELLHDVTVLASSHTRLAGTTL